ncbi:MAG TPA: hypothetical protein VFU55_05620 [Terracidiphilus sp.]|nr:hypothetical protein [Terracidiphilus sp.]
MNGITLRGLKRGEIASVQTRGNYGERGAAGTAAAMGFSLHQRFDAEAILGGPMHPEQMQPERDSHVADGLALAEPAAMTVAVTGVIRLRGAVWIRARATAIPEGM